MCGRVSACSCFSSMFEPGEPWQGSAFLSCSPGPATLDSKHLGTDMARCSRDLLMTRRLLLAEFTA